MACSFNNKDIVVNNIDQHQRSSSNIIMSNAHLEATQQVADHFRKSLDNISLTVSSQQMPKSSGLPQSFYIKPAKQPSNQHSRDGSTDSSGYNSTQSPQSTISSGVAHSRAHSSPATLTSNQLSIPQQKNSSRREGARSVSNHPNRSLDLCNIDDDQQPLPTGWEKAYMDNGQPFFINRELKQTTLTDPRQIESFNRPTSVVDADLGPLPPNWEESYTAEGHKYFINHNLKVTTWYDPRLPEDVQRPTILQRHAMQQHQPLVGANNPHMNVGATSRMLPQGIYQPPTHLHHMAGGANQASAAVVHGLPSHMMASNSRTVGGTYSPNSQKRVQDLNRERQSYRMRQEDLIKQGLLTDHVSSGHPLSPAHNGGAESVAPYPVGLGSSASTSMNTHQTGDYHFRQESSDSGVGMTTFGYSQPENFLNSDFPPLNIAGIDLNLPSAMEVDSLEEIPEISQRDLDQVLNYRSTIRY